MELDVLIQDRSDSAKGSGRGHDTSKACGEWKGKFSLTDFNQQLRANHSAQRKFNKGEADCPTTSSRAMDTVPIT